MRGAILLLAVLPAVVMGGNFKNTWWMGESSRFDTKETTGGWSDSKEGTGGGWSDFKQMYEDFSRTYKLYKEWKMFKTMMDFVALFNKDPKPNCNDRPATMQPTTPLPPAIPVGTCDDMRQGFFPHPDNCMYFLSCIGKNPRLSKCNEGLTFNKDTQMCDLLYGHNCGATRPSTDIPFTTTKRTAATTRRTPATFPTAATTRRTPATFPTAATTRRTPATFPTAVPTTTPVRNPTPTRTPTTVRCDVNNDGLIPNPDNCAFYYMCIGGNPFPVQCTPGLTFNANTNTCDLSSQQNCGATQPPVAVSTTRIPITTTRRATQPTTQTPTSASTTAAIVVPITTTTSAPQPATTRPTAAATCDPLNDDLIPNPASCSFYIMCIGGNGFPVECPAGLTFNAGTKQCDSPANHACKLTGGETAVATTAVPVTPRPTTAAATTTTTTQAPTQAPTRAPTTQTLTRAPTTRAPTRAPTTRAPTQAPTRAPTQAPTRAPTTRAPTRAPTQPPVNLDTICVDNQWNSGIHADPTDCHYYLQCANGISFRFKCNPATAFDPVLLICDFTANIDCSNNS